MLPQLFSALTLRDGALLVLLLAVAAYATLRKAAPRSGPAQDKPNARAKTVTLEEARALFVPHAVGPEFDWAKEPPRRSYPFKDREYKLTMGIRTIDVNEWLLLENGYLDVIAEKTKILTNSHPAYPPGKDLRQSTVFMSPEAEAATRELYTLVTRYMCDKYPMHFERKAATVHNKITDEEIPRDASGQDPERLLELLARTIEEDFIILLPDPAKAGEPYGSEYYFKAGVFAFAAGFDPREKFNQPLSLIHGPIPGYESKLKLSMNRFFDRIQAGHFVTRSNFSIQTHKKYYVDDENKGYHLSEDELKKPIPFESLDFDGQVHYRSERQTLTRLPESRAVVFTIRTYLHPFSKFKDDVPTAQTLRGALHKFPDDLARYKNLVKPRDAVSQYIDGLQT